MPELVSLVVPIFTEEECLVARSSLSEASATRLWLSHALVSVTAWVRGVGTTGRRVDVERNVRAV